MRLDMTMWVCTLMCVHTCLCVCLILLLASTDPRGHSVHIHEINMALSAVWCHTSLTFSLLIWFSNWSHIFTLSLFCCQATWPALNSFGKYFPDVIDIDCKKRMRRCLLSFLFSQFIFHLIYRSMFDICGLIPIVSHFICLLHYC